MTLELIVERSAKDAVTDLLDRFGTEHSWGKAVQPTDALLLLDASEEEGRFLVRILERRGVRHEVVKIDGVAC